MLQLLQLSAAAVLQRNSGSRVHKRPPPPALACSRLRSAASPAAIRAGDAPARMRGRPEPPRRAPKMARNSPEASEADPSHHLTRADARAASSCPVCCQTAHTCRGESRRGASRGKRWWRGGIRHEPPPPPGPVPVRALFRSHGKCTDACISPFGGGGEDEPSRWSWQVSKNDGAETRARGSEQAAGCDSACRGREIKLKAGRDTPRLRSASRALREGGWISRNGRLPFTGQQFKLS